MMRKDTRDAYAPITDLPTVRTTGRAGDEHRIGLEINAAKLYQLLACGAVSVADFRCLDPGSKGQVRDLCLRACMRRLHENVATGTPPQQRMN